MSPNNILLNEEDPFRWRGPDMAVKDEHEMLNKSKKKNYGNIRQKNEMFGDVFERVQKT